MAKKYISIRRKILFILLSISLLSISIVGGISYVSIGKVENSSLDVILEKNKDTLQLMAKDQSKIIREILSRTEQSIVILAENLFREESKNENIIFQVLESMKNHNPYIYNTFLVTAADNKISIFSKDPNFKVNTSYDPSKRPWYQKAIKSKDLVWSQVYSGEYSKQQMITCAKGVPDAQGNIFAVIGIDLTIDDINTYLINTQIEESGYAFLIDGKGNLIARPEKLKSDPQWDEIFTIPVGMNLYRIKDANFQSSLTKMISKQKGVLEWKRSDGSDKFIAFDTATATNWTLGLVISQDDIEQEARSLFLHHFKNLSTYLAIILFMIIMFVILFSIVVSKKITHPIKALNDGAQKVGNGNLDYTITIKSGDELEQLASQFNKMSANLKHYIADLENITKQKERIESELSIASRIQLDMLPMIFPPFPDIESIDIFASMSAAKQVGGDFYDFFLINPNKLCFVIGDVSGKGIPASLFMVISKTLIKSEAMRDIPPAEVLSNVNNLLSESNDEMMFVTVLLCMINLTTGEITFANGGHNPPLLMGNEKSADFVQLNKSKILGVFPDIAFSNQNLVLTSGETFFLYTDGVTEAMNPENLQYSEERLQQTLSGLQQLPVEKIEAEVQRTIKAFVKDAEQSDDITMLIVRYK